MSEEDWPKALTCCERAIEYYNHHFRAWRTKGYILEAMENYSEALEAYGQALALEPNNSDALFDQASTLQKMGRCAEAIALYDKLAKSPARKETALLCKSKVLGFIKHYLLALDICEQLLVTNPENIGALIQKGYLMHEMGNRLEALEIYDRVLSKRSKHFAVVLMLKSMVLEDLGRIEEAMQVREIAHQSVMDSIDNID
jgi:tetratricopeptide (TPR) repeat protein